MQCFSEIIIMIIGVTTAVPLVIIAMRNRIRLFPWRVYISPYADEGASTPINKSMQRKPITFLNDKWSYETVC